MFTVRLSSDDLARWRAQGHLLLKRPFDEATLGALAGWTEALAAWPEAPGRWMKYFEPVEGARTLCRVENFLDDHEGWRGLLLDPALLEALSALMGEPATLFKEKVNFKLPGGAGFTAHQDAPAFTTFGQTYHVTLMIAVDACDEANGCLEVSDPLPGRALAPQAADGTIDAAAVARMRWWPIEMEAGDALVFDSYLPHRSGPNRSDRSRRACYFTYNPLSQGERRADYYADKRRSFPPDCEREPGRDYSDAGVYNLGNPIR